MAVFKNQRGSWTCKFYYTDWTGKKKQKKKEGFLKKSQAKEFENDFLNNCKCNVNIKFSNLVKHYLEDCRARLKPTTCQTKENIINDKILFFFSDVPIGEIDCNIIRKWQNLLVTNEHNYSNTYIRTINSQLSAIFNYAVKYYHLDINPVVQCGRIGSRRTGIMQFWTAEEFNQFIACVDKPLYQTIFNLLFFSGMRIGELLALTPNDFDDNENRVTISKTYAVVHGEGIIQSPKTEKSRRTVTLPPQITYQVLELAESLHPSRADDRIFITSRQTIRREMDKACNLSGVKKIRIHDLRHSHASLLIEMGVSPLVICERLGHESIETTLNTYSHLYPNKHKEVAQKLESYFSTIVVQSPN